MRMKRSLYLLVFLIQHIYSLGHGSSGNDTYDCGDCSGIVNDNGKVTGSYCHESDRKSLLKNRCLYESAFPKCMPKCYEIPLKSIAVFGHRKWVARYW
ncbi:uncharacterized protein LOC108107893 isoform X2 [Drosophila eugracilis]|uniref:uncharacterized protein LOC108107893 isoform X2 n=1 Tax=Drosophila eugracilis TaxID=29029 RepID=UPI0007E5EEE3|nr:uncharacterized protein LOC108107893 isoform X2 [Drosophila eugracilis]